VCGHAREAEDSLSSRAEAVAPLREEQFGLAARAVAIDLLHLASGRGELLCRAGPQIDVVRCGGDGVAEHVSKAPRQFCADGKATWSDRRAKRSTERGAAQGRRDRSSDIADEASPASMDHRHRWRVIADDGNRDAVGRQGEQGPAEIVSPDPVARGILALLEDSKVLGADHERPVLRKGQAALTWIDTEPSQQPLTVRPHGLAGIACREPEVQRTKRPVA
jgi:hypothetical protein